MRIIEIFHSLQGEGPHTGERTSFIRTARCNLRCRWCDSTYTFGPGVERTISSIVREVRGHRTRFACLTGGEPLLQREGPELVRHLAQAGLTTVVETGGSLDVGPYLDIPRADLSVDVKCPSSGMEGRNLWTNLAKLRAHDVVKFVIADRRDYLYARRVVRGRALRAPVVFQPVWGSNAGVLADWVLADHLNVRVLLQEHKHLWGDVRGR